MKLIVAQEAGFRQPLRNKFTMQNLSHAENLLCFKICLLSDLVSNINKLKDGRARL